MSMVLQRTRQPEMVDEIIARMQPAWNEFTIVLDAAGEKRWLVIDGDQRGTVTFTDLGTLAADVRDWLTHVGLRVSRVTPTLGYVIVKLK